MVDQALEAGSLLALAGEYKEPLITGISMFDLYQGPPLAENEKSIGLRIRYRSPERTLTEDEITPIHQGLIQFLIGKTGGSLRK